jgi:glycerol transport system ATP-binding protein
MGLELKNISLVEGGEDWISDVSVTFGTGISVLVGPNLAGKTTLMRIIAGLTKPTTGTIELNGVDITETNVRDRSVSFVYQQFINYPAFSVFDNIASPLKVSPEKPSKDEIAARVEELAKLLGLTPFLKRKPSELSGGQQQRVAIARALARKSDLVLLDEPLANLDYKLREQLRDELQDIFSEADNVVLYSTAEPSEALDFANHTVAMFQGRVEQEGIALDLYRNPAKVTVAQALSDPPINLVSSTFSGGTVSFGSVKAAFTDPSLQEGHQFTLGIQPHRIHLVRSSPSDIEFSASVQLAEVTGSITYIHATLDTGEYVVIELDGAHPMEPDSTVTGFFPTSELYGFDTDSGSTLFVPKVTVK